MEFLDLGQSGGGAAIHLHDEMGIPGRKGGGPQLPAGGSKGEGIGDFQRRGKVAGIEDFLHGGGGHGELRKNRGQHRPARRLGDQAQRGLRDDSQHPFRAGENADEVEAGLILMQAAAGAQDFATGQHDLQPEDVITGDAVLQTARTAGVGGDVATDGAILQRGRIRRVFPPDGMRGGLQVSRDYAGLDDGHAILRMQPEHAVHPGCGEDDTTLDRHRTADVAVARAAGGDRDFPLVRQPEHRGNIGCGFRENDNVREMARRPFITGIRREDLGGSGDFPLAQQGMERNEQVVGLGSHVRRQE